MGEKKNPDELLLAGECIQFAPRGYSMYPLFDPKKGDQAIVEPLAGRPLRRGMVALYRRDGDPSEMDADGNSMGILVLHRIVRVEGDKVYFIGDNQEKTEGPLRQDQVRGVMTARVRGEKILRCGNPLYKLSTGLWLFLLPCRPFLRRTLAKLKKLFVH